MTTTSTSGGGNGPRQPRGLGPQRLAERLRQEREKQQQRLRDLPKRRGK